MPNAANTTSISPFLLPLLTILITWIGSVFLFSIQHKKAVQNKWLDSFRSEMANFIAAANGINPRSTKEELAVFSKAFLGIQFLLEPSNNLHKALKAAMDKLQQYALSTDNRSFDSTIYTTLCKELVTTFQKIVKQERKKMLRLF